MKNFLKSQGFITPARSRGFTLIEALIAVSIIGIVGFVLTDLMLKSFSGSSKTQLITNVKQNGQSAINTMDQAIEFASPVVCTSTNVVVVQTKDSNYLRFYFYYPNDNTLNNYIAQDSPNVSSFNVTTFNTTPAILCDLAQAPPNSPTALTDRDPLNGVALLSGQFIRTQVPGGKDIIKISFNLGPGQNASNNYKNQAADPTGIPFQTSITVR